MQNFIDDMVKLEESVKKAKIKPLSASLAESAAMVAKIQSVHLPKLKNTKLRGEIEKPLDLILESIHQFEGKEIDIARLKSALSEALHTEDTHLSSDLEMVIVALEQLR